MAGGVNLFGEMLRDTEVLDLKSSSSEWEAAGPLSKSRANVTILNVNGGCQILLGEGQDAVEEFDPTSKTWTKWQTADFHPKRLETGSPWSTVICKEDTICSKNLDVEGNKTGNVFAAPSA